MIRYFIILVTATMITDRARGEPYSVAYEANTLGEYPEDVGFERLVAEGGAQRAVADGVLTLRSTDSAVSDGYRLSRSGGLNPGPGETFYAEWRMRLLRGSGEGDTRVYVASDSYAGAVSIGWGEDHVRFYDRAFERLDATEFHTYRIESTDMKRFSFLIDGLTMFTGSFDLPTSLSSTIIWGDPDIREPSFDTYSSSQWDYFRVGVVPLGSPPVLLGACLVGLVALSGWVASYFAMGNRGAVRNSVVLLMARPPPGVCSASWDRVRWARIVLRLVVVLLGLTALWFGAAFVINEWQSRVPFFFTGRALGAAFVWFAILCLLLQWIPVVFARKPLVQGS